MGKEKFPERNVDSDVAGKVGTLEVLKPPKGLKFKVEVEMDSKLEKEAGKDPLLKAEMWEKVNDVYDDLVERIADNLKKTDKGAIQLRDTNQLEKMKKLVDVVNKGIEGATQIAQEKAEKAVQEHWDELCKKKKEYLKYKIKIVATVVGAAAGLITSITMMAATPFSGGASAAFGIIGMVKSTVTIGKELIERRHDRDPVDRRPESSGRGGRDRLEQDQGGRARPRSHPGRLRELRRPERAVHQVVHQQPVHRQEQAGRGQRQ